MGKHYYCNQTVSHVCAFDEHIFDHLTLAHFKCQGHSHAYFDSDYPVNGGRNRNTTMDIQYVVAYGLSTSVFVFDIDQLYQGQGHTHSNSEYLGNVDR